jgi:uncharacterized protein YjbI with pentapeptide repeats
MKLARRLFLLATATGAISLTPKPGLTQAGRVSQKELNEAIRLHGMWLADMNSGQKCSFGGRDLSGLQFGTSGGPPVNLSGADFAQTDLSRTEADDILVHHCNFNGAKFEGCCWRKPVFAFADMRRVSGQRVRWGIPGPRGSSERLLADFSHVVLCGADLSEARICGFFYGANLNGARLTRSDLSFSDFIGPKFCHEMSFFRAELTGARLRHCQISNASFSKATCTEADFSGTVFSNVER